MAVLSICITVYNQINILKNNLDILHNCNCNDFVVIVSDDNSTDDIKSLVYSYNDNRFKYYRNNKNLGHDLNILAALKHCNTDYVMILRSRDLLLSNSIVDLINELYKDNLSSSYLLFSANDENGNIKLNLKDKVFNNVESKLIANKNLLIHPSGNIYQLSDLNIDLYESYIDRFFKNSIYGFCVHNLIRMDLIIKKNFKTFSEKVWQYTDTRNSNDVAQNSTKDNKSVYDPIYIYPRIKCEYIFAKENFNGRTRNILEHQIISKYYKNCIIDFISINKDKKLQNHYNYSEIDFNPYKEHIRFKNIVSEYCDLPDFNIYLHYLFVYNYIVKFHIKPFYIFLKNKFKRVFANAK